MIFFEVVVVVVAWVFAGFANAKTTTVKVGVLAEVRYELAEAVNHAKLAMKHANSDGVLAPWNLSVDMKFWETGGSIGGALDGAIELLEDPLVVGIVGTEDSETTESAAQYASVKKKPMISALSSASYLIDKEEEGVEMLFRSRVTDRLYFKAFARLSRVFEWKRVGVIAPRNEEGYAAVDTLEDELRDVNATLSGLGMFELDEDDSAVDVLSVLRGVEAVGVHVYALLTKSYTRQVIDAFASSGLLDGPNAFVSFDLDVVPTSMLPMLKGWLFVRGLDSSASDDDGFSYVASRFEESYSEDTTRWNCSRGVQKLFGSLAEEPTVWDFAGVPSSYPDASPPIEGGAPGCVDGDGEPTPELGYYDAVWIMVLALRRVLERGGEATDGRALRDELLETDWYGVRSYYAFDPESQDALEPLVVLNVVDNNATLVRVFEATDEFYTTDAVACACLRPTANVTWSSGNVRPGPPRDGRQISAAKSDFANAIEVYDKLGNATTTVNLLSHFETIPDFGTLFFMQLIDRIGAVEAVVAWNGTYAAPGGVNSTQLPIVIPDWGTYTLLVTDLYENTFVQDSQLPITVSQPECSEDDEGYDEATGQCVACAAGREKIDNVCTDCQPGRYRAAGSAWSSCLICGVTQYQPEYGSLSCLDCPSNSTRYDYDFQNELGDRGYSIFEIERLLGISIEQCLCKEGYYASTGSWSRDHSVDAKTAGASWGDNGTSCEPCPSGGSCSGKTYAPANKNQYWGDPQNPVGFEACDQARCARNYRCKAGYRGRLCSRLRTFKFFTIGGITQRCWFDEHRVITFFVYLLLFGAILALWVWVNLFLDSLAITIFVQHIQSLAIISQFGVEYPRRPISYFGILLNFALFDADIVTPSCIVKWSQLSTFYLSIIIALLGLLFYLAPLAELVRTLVRDDSLRRSYFDGTPFWLMPYHFLAMLRLEFSYYRGSVGQEAATATANALSLLDAIYPNLCFNFMRMLTKDQDSASKASYTRMDATLRWGSPRHMPAAIIAVVGGVLVVIGLPAGIFATIRNNYKLYYGVHEPPSLARWGWAYASFRSPYHMTAIMFHLQTIAFCAVATGFQSSSLQTVLALVISVAAFTYIATALPFEESRYNIFTIIAELTVLLFIGTSVLVKERRLRGAWTVITAAELFVFLVATIIIYVMERSEVRKRAKIKSRMGRTLRLTKPNQKNRVWKRRYAARESNSWNSNGSSSETLAHPLYAKVLGVMTNLGRRDSSSSTSRGGEICDTDETYAIDNEDLPRPHERAVISRALDGLSRAVEPCCMWAWCNDSWSQTEESKRLVQSVARDSESILHASSPLSQYSADHKAAFWRSLTENYRGIVGFAANTLTYSERIVVFGVLVKLQRFLANMTLDELAVDDIVAERNRSSVLYCLLSAQADDDSLAQFLRDALDAKRRAAPPVFIERTVLLPASILRYVTTHRSDKDKRLQRAASTRETIDEDNKHRTHLMLIHGRERKKTELEHLTQQRRRKLVEFEFREEAAIHYIEQFNDFNARENVLSRSNSYSSAAAAAAAAHSGTVLGDSAEVADDTSNQEPQRRTSRRNTIDREPELLLRRDIPLEVLGANSGN
ncbi:hypothetical protein CTAYLR_000903 [Chrysophaeum taylorii]|uniref:Receptor ligand binding region domain-containing protein n=1 Tax=Chrysophaeum taylorii TaxID=2483200 RepID=A0AAD7XMJ5_9STRA|nr:hypothetical protein CTAYLR_000903 [Chrysophaeum taylorii]